MISAKFAAEYLIVVGIVFGVAVFGGAYYGGWEPLELLVDDFLRRLRLFLPPVPRFVDMPFLIN